MFRPVLGGRNEEELATPHYRRSDGIYARVTTIEGAPDRIDNAKRHLQEQALPQLRQMEGFEGFVALGDGQSGKLLGVAFWASEEALLAMEQAVSGVRGGAAKAAGGTLAGVEHYEVHVYEVPSAGPVSGVTDTVGGATGNLLGGGEKSGRGGRRDVSSEENKAVVRRLYEEVFNGGNLDLADDLVAPDGVNHAAPPGGPAGPEGVRRIVGMLRAAFPDDRHEIEDMLAEGDRVAVRITHTGTHEGVFRGAPPTGRRFEQSQMHVLRLEGGKVAEHWAVRDELGMMQQLGLLPEPGGPGASAAG